VRFGGLLEDLTLSLALRSCRSRFWVGRWSYDEKVRLIEETMQVGETVCDVARRHGLAQSLLFTWRRQARQGCLGSEAVPTLIPVEIASAPPASASTCAPQLSSPPGPRAKAGTIEIELGSCRVRVDRDVDTEALQRVLELLRRR
jgi:transposase